MCIIVAKPEGVKPPSIGNLENCFDNNSHGAGYMILRKGAKKVKVRKGFMSWEAFLENYQKEKIQDSDIVISHFRISTSGKVDAGNCHPYVITNKKSMLRNTSVNTSRTAVAHNGIISELNGIDKVLNDSQLFARDYLSAPEVYNNIYESEVIQSLIEGYIGSSKLAFLNHKEGLLLLGNFIEEKGVLYSNSTYKSCYYYNKNLYNQDYGWGAYYSKKESKLIENKNTKDSYSDSAKYIDKWECDMCSCVEKTRWSFGWTSQLCEECELSLEKWEELSLIQRGTSLSTIELEELESWSGYAKTQGVPLDVSFDEKGMMEVSYDDSCCGSVFTDNTDINDKRGD